MELSENAFIETNETLMNGMEVVTSQLTITNILAL